MTRKKREAMKNIRSAVAPTVLVLLILLVAAGSITYFVWTSRGDIIQFSPRGDLGLGSHAVYVKSTNAGVLHIGTVTSLLFVRDSNYDQKTQDLFNGRGVPGGGAHSVGAHSASGQPETM